MFLWVFCLLVGWLVFFGVFWISAQTRQSAVKPSVLNPRVLPHTWPTQIPVLLLFTGIHLHTPGMVGKWEQVFYLGRRADGIVQTLKPILTLLKSRKLTPVTERSIYLLILSNRCQIITSDRLWKHPWKQKNESKHLTGNLVLLLYILTDSKNETFGYSYRNTFLWIQVEL